MFVVISDYFLRMNLLEYKYCNGRCEVLLILIYIVKLFSQSFSMHTFISFQHVLLPLLKIYASLTDKNFIYA